MDIEYSSPKKEQHISFKREHGIESLASPSVIAVSPSKRNHPSWRTPSPQPAKAPQNKSTSVMLPDKYVFTFRNLGETSFMHRRSMNLPMIFVPGQPIKSSFTLRHQQWDLLTAVELQLTNETTEQQTVGDWLQTIALGQGVREHCLERL
jgi:hypothetical protein